MGNRTHGIAYFTQHPVPDHSQTQFVLKGTQKAKYRNIFPRYEGEILWEIRLLTCVRNNNIGPLTSEEYMKNTLVQEKLMETILKRKRIQASK